MFNRRPLWHSGTQNDRAMRKRDGVYLVIIFVLLWVCGHLWEQTQRRGVIDVIDKDTLVTAPTASGSQQVGTWTVSVPKIGVSVPKMGNFVPETAINVPKLTKNVPKAESGGDTATYGTEDAEDISITDRGDSLQVKIPITQKKYEDSLYTAWVSGYRATLDAENTDRLDWRLRAGRTEGRYWRGLVCRAWGDSSPMAAIVSRHTEPLNFSILWWARRDIGLNLQKNSEHESINQDKARQGDGCR